MKDVTMVEPIRKSVVVRRPVSEAFEIFTTGMNRWWPLRAYSVSAERAAKCALEPREGGRVYEVRDDGETFDWGIVHAWEPPHRFVMSWHPGREEDTAQELEVRFMEEGGGTRVELEHRGWERLREKVRETRQSYDTGWDAVLGRHFVEHCGGSSAVGGEV